MYNKNTLKKIEEIIYETQRQKRELARKYNNNLGIKTELTSEFDWELRELQQLRKNIKEKVTNEQN